MVQLLIRHFVLEITGQTSVEAHINYMKPFDYVCPVFVFFLKTFDYATNICANPTNLIR